MAPVFVQPGLIRSTPERALVTSVASSAKARALNPDRHHRQRRGYIAIAEQMAEAQEVV